MTRKDRDALKRCMDIAMTEPLRAEQLFLMLKDEPWEDVARFAAPLCPRPQPALAALGEPSLCR